MGEPQLHPLNLPGRSFRLSNENVSPELSGEEIRKIVPDEGHMYDQEFVIDNIVDHVTEHGSYLFRVRWYAYGSDDDTWENVEYLARSQIVNYLRRLKLRLPTQRSLAKAMPG